MTGRDWTDGIMQFAVTADMVLAEMARVRSAGDKTAEEQRAKILSEMAEDLALREDAAALHASQKAAKLAASDRTVRNMPGDEFALDVAEDLPVIWGHPDAPLMIEGEALLIVGGDGVGKSTISQQLVLARIGLREGCLGLPVEVTTGRVLYLALDRPAQIRRSFNRMVTEDQRDILRDRLVTWSGPLPINPLGDPREAADWIQREFGPDIDTVIVDSYKDLAPGLSDDKVGAQLNLAMQEVLARGIQWVGLHHQRKPATDRTADYVLSDVYGSRWLTAGAGSVVMVLGEAGDTTVELRHVKQPAGVVGPLFIQHDHQNGRSTVARAAMTVLQSLRMAEGTPMSLKQLCEEVYGEFSDRLRKKVERELRRLCADAYSGVLTAKGIRGGSGGSAPATWWFEEPNNIFDLPATKGRAKVATAPTVQNLRQLRPKPKVASKGRPKVTRATGSKGRRRPSLEGASEDRPQTLTRAALPSLVRPGYSGESITEEEKTRDGEVEK